MNRYDSYKDSGVEWIGEIPMGWEIRPTFYFCENEKNENTIGSTNVLSLSYGKIVQRDLDTNKGLLPKSFDSYQLLEPGSVVLRLTDLQNDKKSLRVGLCRDVGIITSVYLSLKSNRDELIDEYLYYHLHNSDIKKVFYNMGGGVRQSMSYGDFRRFPLLVPPLNEQKQIVSYLDEKTTQIDSLIQSKEKKITLLKEKRTSLINQVVTKGLNPNIEMKDSGVGWIGEIPSGWGISKIKFHTSIISKGTTPTTIGKEIKTDGVIRFIKGENITENGLEFSSEYYIDEETHNLLSRSQLKENDVLFVIAGTIGKCCILKREHIPSNTSQAISFIRLKNSENHNFILYLLKSDLVKIQFDILVVKSAQPNLSMEDLSNLCITYPPLSEQKQIVEYLDRETELIDKTVSIEERKIELLKEYKQSLISEVVTGKRKVVN